MLPFFASLLRWPQVYKSQCKSKLNTRIKWLPWYSRKIILSEWDDQKIFSLKYEQKKNILGVIHNHAIFPGGVGIFDLIFLSHFLSKMGSFCAHQKGNFLRFSKLTLLLSLVHSWCPLWPIKHKIAFFLGHPVYLWIYNICW